MSGTPLNFKLENFLNTKKSIRTLTALSASLVFVSLSAFAADRKIFVANEGAGTVSVIDGATFKVTGHIAVGAGAHNVQVSPDGKLAWVTNNGAPKATDSGKGHSGAGHGAMAQSGEVWAIDTNTDAVVARVVVGKHPAHVVVSADNRWAYVTNGGDNTVSVVDTASLKVADTVLTGEYPHGLRLSPDGKQVYVANLKGNTVSVIDTDSRKEVGQIPVGKGPAQVGFTSDGQLAFVSLSQEASVAVIDPVSRKVIRKVYVGDVPIQLYATPDNRFLFVANQGSRKNPGNTVSVIDLANFSTQQIQVGSGAHGVVVGTDGRHAYVSNLYANTVTVIDVHTSKTVATVSVGAGPNGISVTP